MIDLYHKRPGLVSIMLMSDFNLIPMELYSHNFDIMANYVFPAHSVTMVMRHATYQQVRLFLVINLVLLGSSLWCQTWNSDLNWPELYVQRKEIEKFLLFYQSESASYFLSVIDLSHSSDHWLCVFLRVNTDKSKHKVVVIVLCLLQFQQS